MSTNRHSSYLVHSLFLPLTSSFINLFGMVRDGWSLTIPSDRACTCNRQRHPGPFRTGWTTFQALGTGRELVLSICSLVVGAGEGSRDAGTTRC